MDTLSLTFPNGRWRQNCHVFAAPSGEALVFDPGSEAASLQESLAQRSWTPAAILLTHGHYDHVGAVAALADAYGAPVYMHGADMDLLRRANLYRLVFEGRDAIKVPAITHDLREQPEELVIGPFRLLWLSTPGHTPGSVCFRMGAELITGDTLFATGTGRTDLPGSDKEKLVATLAHLATLPAHLIIRPGHGPSAPLGEALATTGAP